MSNGEYDRRTLVLGAPSLNLLAEFSEPVSFCRGIVAVPLRPRFYQGLPLARKVYGGLSVQQAEGHAFSALPGMYRLNRTEEQHP